jgi:hypothetical protein
MYDMYRWDQPERAADGGGGRTTAGHTQPAVSGAVGTDRPPAANGAGQTRRATGARSSGAQAVQVALDRRDNGGDSGAARDQ